MRGREHDAAKPNMPLARHSSIAAEPPAARRHEFDTASSLQSWRDKRSRENEQKDVKIYIDGPVQMLMWSTIKPHDRLDIWHATSTGINHVISDSWYLRRTNI